MLSAKLLLQVLFIGTCLLATEVQSAQSGRRHTTHHHHHHTVKAKTVDEPSVFLEGGDEVATDPVAAAPVAAAPAPAAADEDVAAAPAADEEPLIEEGADGVCFRWNVNQSASVILGERVGHCTWSAGGYLFSYGGCTASNDAYECFTDLHKYDPVNQTWEEIPVEIPEGVNIQGRGQACTYSPTSGILYMYGGYRVVPNANALDAATPTETVFSRELNSLQELCDTDIGCTYSWSTVATTGTPPDTYGHTLNLVGKNLFLFGGISDEGPKNEVWSLDLSAKVWVEQTSTGLTPDARRGHTATTVGNQVYIFGGTNGEDTFGDLSILTVEEGSYIWSTVDSGDYQPSVRSEHTAVLTADNDILIIGGCDRLVVPAACYNDVHIFNLSSNTWVTTSTSTSDLLITKEGDSTRLPATSGLRATMVDDTTILVMGGCDDESVCAPGMYALDTDAACPEKCGENADFVESVCVCDGDYSGKFCEIEAPCLGNCSGNGECYTIHGFHYCRCADNYWGNDCAYEPCPNNCGSHGYCHYDADGAVSQCICDADYSGEDCSTAGPDVEATAPCTNGCSGHGSCVEGECTCLPGYLGDDCSETCPNLCNGHDSGACEVDGSCACWSGFEGPSCEQTNCGEADHCSGHGACANDLCFCETPWSGGSCQHDSTCSNNGEWNSFQKTCTCSDGFGGPFCSLPLTCPRDCSSNGACRDPVEVATSFLQLTRFATFDGMCVCNEGFTGEDCSLLVCPDDSQCSGNGNCNTETGECECYPGYASEDCTTIVNCPNNCTSIERGTCEAETETCICQLDWTGDDCSDVACPNGCSGHGTCVQGLCLCENVWGAEDCGNTCDDGCGEDGVCYHGECLCAPGKDGPACTQVAKCPADVNGRECSSVGVCISATQECLCPDSYSGEACEVDEGGECGTDGCNGRGVCQKGKCICDFGFYGLNCTNTAACTDNCNSNGFCIRGTDGADMCECFTGFDGPECQNIVMETDCPNSCSGHGICQDGVCDCVLEYMGEDCSEVAGFCSQTNCSTHGSCEFDKCFCDPGYSGAECESGGCTLGCSEEHGSCILGQCLCKPGYGGETCSEELTCPSTHEESECSGRGICQLGTCRCFPGFGGEDCMDDEPLTVDGEVVVCIDDCNGRGVCVSGTCFCIDGFDGEDCSIENYDRANQCPSNETGVVCSGNGACRKGVCYCDADFSGEDCATELVCSSACLKNGICSNGICVCVAGFKGDDCEETMPEEELVPLLEMDMMSASTVEPCGTGNDLGCSYHGVCIENSCACEAGWSGSDCSEGVPTGSCTNGCSGHGHCLFDKCYCDVGFTGESCSIQAPLPCENDCSGHGVCRFGKCYCDFGFRGEDCSTELTCGRSCGSHGVCVNSLCRCSKYFEGDECNIKKKNLPKPNPKDYEIMGFEEEKVEDVEVHIEAPHSKSARTATYPGHPTYHSDINAAEWAEILTHIHKKKDAAEAGSEIKIEDSSFLHIENAAKLFNCRVEKAQKCEPNGVCVSNQCFCLPGFGGESCEIFVSSLEEPQTAANGLPVFTDEQVIAPSVGYHHQSSSAVAVGLGCFAFGVFISTGVKYLMDKRQQIRRQQAMLKPLLTN